MITSGHSALDFTVREESPRNSLISNEDRGRILSKWRPDQDEIHESFVDRFYYWNWPRELGPHKPISRDMAVAAQNYVNFIVKRLYPHGIRERMGYELWYEFCEYWVANPNF